MCVQQYMSQRMICGKVSVTQLTAEPESIGADKVQNLTMSVDGCLVYLLSKKESYVNK